MSFARVLEDETLDHLAETDPRAIHSRRDLQRINWLMGSAGIIGGVLKEGARAPKKIIELGAGDGTLMLKLAERFSSEWPDVHLTLLDRQNLVSEKTHAAFERLGWQLRTLNVDLMDWIGRSYDERWDVCVANLFIHHFDERQITALFNTLSARTDLFVACEPRRERVPLYASHLVGLVGANKVTREDAVLSVRAGFCGGELSALWPRREGWRLHEQSKGLFSHLFTAEKLREQGG